jgi:hypothetical protein
LGNSKAASPSIRPAAHDRLTIHPPLSNPI